MPAQDCETSDLARGWTAMLLWGVPVIALVAGSYFPRARLVFWLPALLVMDGLPSKRSAMRASALLPDGAARPAGSVVCRSVGFPRRSDATGHVSEYHPRRSGSRMSGRNSVRQIQKDSLRRIDL
jgi:hypothetical protein